MENETNSLDKPDKTSANDKTRLINFCIIASPVLLIIGYFTGEYLFFIPAFIMVIYVHKNKPITKQEKDRREDLSNKSFAASLFIPIIVIFVILIFVLIKIIPLIFKNYQG